MEVIFKVWLDYVDSNGRKHSSTYAMKKIDLPIMPTIGMEIDDSAWKHPMKVKNVILNIDKPYTYIYLGSINCDDERGFNKVILAHRDNRWDIRTDISHADFSGRT